VGLDNQLSQYEEWLLAPFDTEDMKVESMSIRMLLGYSLPKQSLRFLSPKLLSKVNRMVWDCMGWYLGANRYDDGSVAACDSCKTGWNIRLAVDYRQLNEMLEPRCSRRLLIMRMC
jgi:hypothetical protein